MEIIRHFMKEIKRILIAMEKESSSQFSTLFQVVIELFGDSGFLLSCFNKMGSAFLKDVDDHVFKTFFGHDLLALFVCIVSPFPSLCRRVPLSL